MSFLHSHRSDMSTSLCAEPRWKVSTLSSSRASLSVFLIPQPYSPLLISHSYGQTASGKTFTLSGNAANPGIIPQAVTDIFSYIRDHPEKEFLLRASYLEIYNETLKDLLAPETGALKIRQDEKVRCALDCREIGKTDADTDSN